jgi:hypothetical protein
MFEEIRGFLQKSSSGGGDSSKARMKLERFERY